jgi:hypothetical protein
VLLKQKQQISVIPIAVLVKTTIASDLKVTGKLGIGESSPTTPLHIECADTSTHYQNGLLVKQSSSSYPAILGIRNE